MYLTPRHQAQLGGQRGGALQDSYGEYALEIGHDSNCTPEILAYVESMPAILQYLNMQASEEDRLAYVLLEALENRARKLKSE